VASQSFTVADGERFRPAGGWTCSAPRTSFAVPGEISVAVGPDDIPVLARAGAALALLPEDTGSPSPYAPPLTSRRTVLAFPGKPGEDWGGALGPGLSGRSRWNRDSWLLALSGPQDASYEVRAWLPADTREAAAAGPWSSGAGVLTCSVPGRRR